MKAFIKRHPNLHWNSERITTVSSFISDDNIKKQLHDIKNYSNCKNYPSSSIFVCSDKNQTKLGIKKKIAESFEKQKKEELLEIDETNSSNKNKLKIKKCSPQKIDNNNKVQDFSSEDETDKSIS